MNTYYFIPGIHVIRSDSEDITASVLPEGGNYEQKRLAKISPPVRLKHNVTFRYQKNPKD